MKTNLAHEPPEPQHDVGNAEYKHRTFITSNHRSTGIDYEGCCEITIDLGGGDE